MTKTAVLIPDGESTLTKHVVHCLAQEKDIEIHVLSKDPRSSIKHSRFVSTFHAYDPSIIGEVVPPRDGKVDPYMEELIRFHHYDGTKGDALVAEIIRYIQKTKAQVVFPVDEHIVKILASRRDAIGREALLAPLPDLETFTLAIDKWRLAEFLKGSDVPHPSTVKYSKGVSEKAIHELHFPVIIKPIDQGNALGIYTFQNPTELLAFFEGQKLQHEYIVQSFIDGYDIDCSCLCSEGRMLAYTIQRGILASKNRFAAAVGIEFLYDESVLKVVEKLMKRLNWSGVAHLDLRYDQKANEIKVIEVNARYWGSLLGSLNAGINFPLLAVKTSKGEAFEKKEYGFVRYFMGKSPLKKLWKTAWGPTKDRVRLRDTSLYYTLRDPMPVLFEMMAKFRR